MSWSWGGDREHKINLGKSDLKMENKVISHKFLYIYTPMDLPYRMNFEILRRND